MIEYIKTPFTRQQHLELLESRGLEIGDVQEAMKFLKQVNYYRFSAYCIPFQKPRDVFLPETTFRKIIELYRFDEALRLAVFQVITRVEIFLRTCIVYEMSHRYGAFAHYNLSMFHNRQSSTQWLSELEEDIVKSTEPFLEHYRLKYHGFPRLPLWIAIELMSLGSLSKLYSNLTTENRNRVCLVFEVNHNVLKSWLHTITFLRNICAHHGRLWSRNFSIKPLIPDKNPPWSYMVINDKKLYTTVTILEWMYRKIELPLSDFKPVFETINQIAALDSRFSSWMGISEGKKAGFYW